jgi:hypothetical protein
MRASSIIGRAFAILCMAICMWALPLAAQPTSTGEWLGCVGLGTLGGLAGAVIAVTAIAEIGPQIESGLGRTALVIGGITLFDGIGAATGVLVAGKIWDVEGNIGGCVLGGLVGGLASAFTEPVLYTLGIPEGWTEFFGMALLPLLPAIGAAIGFGR